VETASREILLFVYPRSPEDPAADRVGEGFNVAGEDFSSVLGRVEGTLYVGRTSAGGEGDGLDLDGDGRREVTFSHTCQFILQLAQGKVTAVEADRAVTMQYAGRTLALEAYVPVSL